MKKWKKILCGVLAGVMAVIMPVEAAAVDLEAKYNIETNNVPPWPKASDIMADTGVLMEYSTGTLLFDKGADEKRYPASITKLMTLLVAAENGNLADQVTFTETGIRDISPDSGNLGMQLGEILTLEQCLYGMIIYSANEVATQVAEHVGGTEAKFIEMMNAKAKEIGCKNTNFTNANGLPDPNQYTTARDMALIFRAGLKNKIFRKVVKTRKVTIPPTNMNSQERLIGTHHPLLSKYSSIFDPDCIGGKSGMTNDAGHTLVTGMRKNGMTLIAVVMRDVDINQAGVDSQNLFKYGYENFQKLDVEGGSVVVPNGTTLQDLKIREKPLGEKTRQVYSLADYYVGKGAIQKVETSVEENPEGTEGGEAVEAEEEEKPKSPVDEVKESGLAGLSSTAKILLVVMAVMAFILFILCIMLAVKDFKSSRRRRNREE